MRHSNYQIHAPTLKSERSRLLIRDELKRLAAAVPASASARRLKQGSLPPTLSIGMTGVREDGSFDAYIHVSLQGAAAGSACPLLLDSGNSVLVYPRFEDIQALPNFATDYKVLGAGSEPWGCPANVVQGPVVLTTTDGLVVTIGGAVFYACTADLPGWTADSGRAQSLRLRSSTPPVAAPFYLILTVCCATASGPTRQATHGGRQARRVARRSRRR